MNKEQIVQYFEAIDHHLSVKAEIVVYGSAAFMLLDEDGRTSLDIDIAGPYSTVNQEEFARAARCAGLEVNPEAHAGCDHIEWISALRLCLARPDVETEIILWKGRNLVVKTVSPEDLVASKLIRYDAIDASDIRFLTSQMKLLPKDIVAAVERLPPPFRNDVLVRDNLHSLMEDIELWSSVD